MTHHRELCPVHDTRPTNELHLGLRIKAMFAPSANMANGTSAHSVNQCITTPLLMWWRSAYSLSLLYRDLYHRLLTDHGLTVNTDRKREPKIMCHPLKTVRTMSINGRRLVSIPWRNSIPILLQSILQKYFQNTSEKYFILYFQNTFWRLFCSQLLIGDSFVFDLTEKYEP